MSNTVFNEFLMKTFAVCFVQGSQEALSWIRRPIQHERTSEVTPASHFDSFPPGR